MIDNVAGFSSLGPACAKLKDLLKNLKSCVVISPKLDTGDIMNCEQVVDAGGRIYLAKDARMDPALLPRMYPRLDEWRSVRDTWDPNHRFDSDLARRLKL